MTAEQYERWVGSLVGFWRRALAIECSINWDPEQKKRVPSVPQWRVERDDGEVDISAPEGNATLRLGHKRGSPSIVVHPWGMAAWGAHPEALRKIISSDAVHEATLGDDRAKRQ